MEGESEFVPVVVDGVPESRGRQPKVGQFAGTPHVMRAVAAVTANRGKWVLVDKGTRNGKPVCASAYHHAIARKLGGKVSMRKIDGVVHVYAMLPAGT
jgi:hypothetical protein